MGSGTIQNKTQYTTKKGYYISRDFNELFGGEFYFILEALHGNDDERFFYVKKMPNGLYEVTGEFYIIPVSNEESKKRRISRIKRSLKGKPIWYYHLDENDNVIRKEIEDGL